MDPNKEADKLEKRIRSFSDVFDTKEHMLDSEYEEEARLKRMEQIEKQATKAYTDRCDAKLAEVGGADNLMRIVDSGEWNSDDERTEIEKEYWKLWNEQFHLNWYRDHGKPYDMKDDPNAKF